MRYRKLSKSLAIALVVLTLGAGCAAIKEWVAGPSAGKALIVSGETLDATSLLFETWSKDFAARCAPPKPSLSATICNRSADFQKYFRPAFLNGSGLWRVATKARLDSLASGDGNLLAGATSKQKTAEAIVTELRNELLERIGGK